MFKFILFHIPAAILGTLIGILIDWLLEQNKARKARKKAISEYNFRLSVIRAGRKWQ